VIAYAREGVAAMPANPPQEWFGAKRIGWGVRPQTREGWVITATVVVIIVAVALAAGR